MNIRGVEASGFVEGVIKGVGGLGEGDLTIGGVIV